MNDPVKVLMVGINGYGHYYLKTFLEETDCDNAVLAGVVDPEAARSKYYDAFNEFGIPVYTRMNDFYLSGGKADLAVISSPPHFHSSQSILALHNNTNVLCEKPLCSQITDAEEIIRKRDKSGRFVMVGYQWSYSEGIQSLKKDILAGIYGKPLRIKSLCLWPRDYSYFNRNEWAYRNTDPAGNVVRDNLFNNAMAHFIHNMLFLLGGTQDSSASAKNVKSLLYKAYPVETYDTGAFCAQTDSGVDLLFLGSHAASRNMDPCFRIEFERGFAELKSGSGKIIGKTLDKLELSYPSPDSDHQFKKLFNAIRNVVQPGSFMCSPEAALAHVKLVDMVERQTGSIGIFSEGQLCKSDKRLYVKGLDDFLLSSYRNFRMPADLEIARPGK